MNEVMMNDRFSADSPLDDVSLALERLGAADRAAASSGFEDRVASATFAIIAEGPAPLAVIGPRGTAWWTPLRAAACVGLMASIGLALIASRSGETATGSQLAADTERQVESILSLSTAFDDDLLDELPILSDQANGLSERVRQGLGGTDWLTEGAM